MLSRIANALPLLPAFEPTLIPPLEIPHPFRYASLDGRSLLIPRSGNNGCKESCTIRKLFLGRVALSLRVVSRLALFPTTGKDCLGIVRWSRRSHTSGVATDMNECFNGSESLGDSSAECSLRGQGYAQALRANWAVLQSRSTVQARHTPMWQAAEQAGQS
jgi:hypothetical protein